MFTRKQYIAKECTYREYYGQFVTDEIKQEVLKTFSREQLIQSIKDDEHFNNLPIRKWDNILTPGAINVPIDGSQCNRYLRKALNEKLREAESGISFADCVCVCKEAARQIVEESES